MQITGWQTMLCEYKLQEARRTKKRMICLDNAPLLPIAADLCESA
jgi:hypothetical protein